MIIRIFIARRNYILVKLMFLQDNEVIAVTAKKKLISRLRTRYHIFANLIESYDGIISR